MRKQWENEVTNYRNICGMGSRKDNMLKIVINSSYQINISLSNLI